MGTRLPGYREMLPTLALSLLTEIEQATGLTVAFRLDPDMRAPARATGAAEIFFRDLQPASAVMLHEVLHLHRYSVERVPAVRFVNCTVQHDGKVLPRGTCAPFTDEYLENELEHLTIHPKVFEYYPAERAVVEEVLRSRWETEFDISARRWRLLDWISTCLLAPKLQELGCRTLQREGLYQEAVDLPHVARMVLPAKHGITHLVCWAIQMIPPSCIALVDVPTREMRPL